VEQVEVAARWQNVTVQRYEEMRRTVSGEVCPLKAPEAVYFIALSLTAPYVKTVLNVGSC